MPEEKNITIHPVDGTTVQTEINLYPRTKWENIIDKPQITIGAGILTISINGTVAGTFSANATDNQTINITTGESNCVPKDLDLITQIVKPRSDNMSISRQNENFIYIYDKGNQGGTPSKANLNELDYSKVTVQTSENMDGVREKDFAFITNN